MVKDLAAAHWSYYHTDCEIPTMAAYWLTDFTNHFFSEFLKLTEEKPDLRSKMALQLHQHSRHLFFAYPLRGKNQAVRLMQGKPVGLERFTKWIGSLLGFGLLALMSVQTNPKNDLFPKNAQVKKKLNLLRGQNLYYTNETECHDFAELDFTLHYKSKTT